MTPPRRRDEAAAPAASAPRAGGGRPPRDAAEAIGNARAHATGALREALATLRALADAAAFGLGGTPAEKHAGLAPLARGIDELCARIAGGTEALPAPIVRAVLEALDAEIARWEERSGDDADARAVLRAFLGLREILWEFGLRRDARGDAPRRTRDPEATEHEAPSEAEEEDGKEGTDPAPAERPADPARRSSSRVQRVEVQG